MRHVSSALVLVAASSWLTGVASAGPSPQAVIVLDGSGSMGGPLEGQEAVKFDMAREAIRGAVTNADPSKPLGLVVGGHRRKGNCTDVELVIPPAPGTAAAMMARLDRIGTVGKGPLVQALREAAKTFPSGQPGKLVLIHDDPDNCRQDPCAAADEIARSNPQLAVDVVTVSLDPAAGQTMSCLARATGGRHYEAKDAASLTAAVAGALGIAGPSQANPGAETRPKPAAAEPPKASSEGPPRVRVEASLADGGPPLERPATWRVAAKADPQKVVAEATAPVLARELPPGDYVVEARVDHAAGRSDITVAEKGETVTRIALGAASLKVTTRANKSGDAVSLPFVTVSRAPDEKGSRALGEALHLSRSAASDLVLPAGNYVVRAADGLAEKEAPVVLEAGTETAAEFVMGTGRLELSAVASDGGATLGGVTFLIETDDPDQPQGRREIARSAATKPNFLLTAGTYYATARLGIAEARERVAIGTGDVQSRALVLGTGRLEVMFTRDPALAARGGKGEVRVYTAGNPSRLAATAYEGGPELALPQGHYRVVGTLASTRLVSEAEVDVQTGQKVAVELRFESAEVKLDGEGTRPADGVRLEVRDLRGQVVLRSSPGESRTAELSPGSYVLHAVKDGKTADEPFQLNAGEQRSFGTAGR